MRWLVNTALNSRIVGEAGGDWALLRQGDRWQLYTGRAAHAAATVALDQNVAWRLFANGMNREMARGQLVMEG